MEKATDSPRFGFAAVIGAPNAGKSTLINRLVGAKVSIVSPKVQTTRTLVRGIAIKDKSQIVFIDTPGIFRPQKRLERAMVSAAWEGQSGADIVLVLVDAAHGAFDQPTQDILERMAQDHRKNGPPAVLVLNKIDKIKPDALLTLTKKLNERLDFTATFMISALNGDGVAELLSWIAVHVPPGPWHYPEDQISDLPLRLLAAEITREKLFLKLHQELPYALSVETESWETLADGSARVSQIIYVTRENHRKIVLGKGGAMIRTVGESARKDMAGMTGAPVHLNLFVKVRENWSEDPEHYKLWGLDYGA